jgi:hypothetical protein
LLPESTPCQYEKNYAADVWGEKGAAFDLFDITQTDGVITFTANPKETNGIEKVQSSMVSGQSESWYTIDGRRLNGKPTKKGIYIVNGSKRVIK